MPTIPAFNQMIILILARLISAPQLNSFTARVPEKLYRAIAHFIVQMKLAGIGALVSEISQIVVLGEHECGGQGCCGVTGAELWPRHNGM